VQDARCLRCLEAIEATLAARAGHYRRALGVAPEIRVVLHAGPIVAGECGDAKLSIVYLGDTLNTAARIEETAKTLGHDILISNDLLARLDVPPSMRVEPLGPIALRGRAQPILLHALRPAAPMIEAAAE
jgi:adenylate cyclase